MLRILLAVALVLCIADAQVTVTPNSDKVINEGDPQGFTYKCQNGDISGSSTYPVWKDKDQNVIQESSGGANERVYTTQSEEGPYKVTRLTFQNVQLAESGNYTCSVGTNFVTKEVLVAIPITFPRSGSELSQRLLVTTPSSTSSITCTINSNPFPKVFWYFNSNPIQESDTTDRYEMSTSPVTGDLPEGYEHAETATLTVRDVISTDTGSYRCFATVDKTGAAQQMDIEVIAQVPPEWTVKPGDQQEVEGRDITIQCAASGTPKPSYTWRNNDDLLIAETPGKYELTQDGEFLKVMNLEVADDGSYQCIASNDAINSTFSTAITAGFRLKVLIPPTLNPQQNRTVDEGQLFSMDCIITRSDESFELTWRRDGLDREDIIPVGGTWALDPRVSVTQTTETTLTLNLNPSHYDHSGGWTCYAESDAGNSYVTHYLSVESAPFVDYSKTKSRVLSWPGNPVNMTCVMNGYPYPTIKWYNYQNYKLNATEGHIEFLPDQPAGTSVVRITPLQSDFGPYYCKGTNPIDTATMRIDLAEGTVASKPMNVILFDITSSTMRVSYDIPEDDGGFRIYEYQVFYNTGPGTQNETRIYNNITDVLLNDLNGNTRYHVRVAAINERGVGTYSTEVAASTMQIFVPTSTSASVPGKPKITSKADEATSDSYMLRWEHPVDNGGSAIKSYQVAYAQASGPTDTNLGARYLEYTISHTFTSYKLMDLNENKYYNIELSAENDLGTGEPSKIQIKTAGGFVFPSTPETRPEQQVGALGTSQIVAIVVACFIILLILIDVCCFCMNDCGVLMFFCVNCCGKQSPSSKDEIEMGDEEYGNVTKTAPPASDGPPSYQPMENGKSEDAKEEAKEETPAAEEEPLMNKDGAV